MANWISSKLKVAETLLQQIDQQAAESLKKNERPRSDEPKLDTPTKTGGNLSLKDQLKKRRQDSNEYHGKLDSDPDINIINNNQLINDPDPKPKLSKSSSSSTTTTTTTSLTDSDWTELLSSPPNQATTRGNRSGNGVGGLRGGKSLIKSARRSDVALLNSKFNGKPSDGEESCSSGTSSSVGSQNGVKILEGKSKDEDNGGRFDSNIFSSAVNKKNSSSSESDKVDKVGVSDVPDQLRDTGRGKRGSNVGSGSSVSDDLKRGSSSTSDGGSNSDTESGSSSDSETERQREREERRKRRETILAEKAAAKAVEAIKERENMVARLEGEKQSLEKILEERAKQHAQEASQMQTTMMETMEAAELEKQKHNNTRMEVFARLAKLETSNADLARSFASKQKNLEVEIDRVAELREQIELKEVAHGELRRRISNTHQTGKNLNQLAVAKGVEFEREILEAEYSFITDKIERLQDKEKKLEANIEMTRKEIEDPTEVEIELKRRLGQLTDHLIQKQAQVEALSSEKATLLFRIEAVSRLLDENKSTMNDFSSTSSRDMESGMLELTDSKLRPLIEGKIRSGRKHLGSLVQQLDAIFLAGEVFLRRNSTAKLWSLVYLVCLHLWVIYILMSHSQPSNEVRSGAVFSLENINNTTGV